MAHCGLRHLLLRCRPGALDHLLRCGIDALQQLVDVLAGHELHLDALALPIQLNFSASNRNILDYSAAVGLTNSAGVGMNFSILGTALFARMSSSQRRWMRGS
jgi:hypothetical protein